MDASATFRLAGVQVQGAICRLSAADLAKPSPCAGWTVRDLVNHVVGGEIRYAMLFRGAGTAEVEATRDADHLGSDPCGSFARAHLELAAALATPDALDRVVHHRLGDRLGHDLLLMRVMEYVVHGWDLAVAVTGDADIDPEAAGLLVNALTERSELWQGIGVFDRTCDDDPALPAGERLLRLTGRRS